MLIPDKIIITIEPIFIELKISIENSSITQKQIDDLTAKVLTDTQKMKDAEVNLPKELTPGNPVLEKL